MWNALTSYLRCCHFKDWPSTNVQVDTALKGALGSVLETGHAEQTMRCRRMFDVVRLSCFTPNPQGVEFASSSTLSLPADSSRISSMLLNAVAFDVSSAVDVASLKHHQYPPSCSRVRALLPLPLHCFPCGRGSMLISWLCMLCCVSCRIQKHACYSFNK